MHGEQFGKPEAWGRQGLELGRLTSSPSTQLLDSLLALPGLLVPICTLSCMGCDEKSPWVCLGFPPHSGLLV